MKGSSNMTLETIARLEKALNLDIIKSALTYVQGYDITTSGTKNPYLNEPEPHTETVISETAALVDGYALIPNMENGLSPAAQGNLHTNNKRIGNSHRNVQVFFLEVTVAAILVIDEV